MTALQLDNQSGTLVGVVTGYIGLGYVFGGKPADGLGNWDCSSMINWAAGHVLGMPIPGYAAGTYTGAEHGPDTIAWAQWSGARTIADPSPNDIVIWVGAGPNGHMGVVTGPNEMISALNPRDGVRRTPIQGVGPSGVPMIYRSLLAAPGAPVTTTGNPACGSTALMLLQVPAAMVLTRPARRRSRAQPGTGG